MPTHPHPRTPRRGPVVLPGHQKQVRHVTEQVVAAPDAPAARHPTPGRDEQEVARDAEDARAERRPGNGGPRGEEGGGRLVEERLEEEEARVVVEPPLDERVLQRGEPAGLGWRRACRGGGGGGGWSGVGCLCL